MSGYKRLLRYGGGYVAAAAGLFALLGCFAWVVRPDLSLGPVSRSPVEIAAAEQLRDAVLDYDNPLVLHRQVDYAEGEDAAWYPRNESPILAELVAEGALPPVAERVGPEPSVLAGVEGVGGYGGTWIRIARTPAEVSWIEYRLTGSTLVRWSPYGDPIVPSVAKSFAANTDNTEFTFELRRGMKWSDGHPFTADDILYWWEHEATDQDVMALPPEVMRIRGMTGNVEKLGPYRVRFTFPESNALFLSLLARSSREITSSPKHYLSRYHPTLGDTAAIGRWMRAKRLPSKMAVYTDVKEYLNPEHPRLWPWLYRTYKTTPPWTVVRNPYYWAVDPEGNQLPYIDRILFKSRSADMIHLALSNGEASMQWQWDLAKSYTLVMDQREEIGYDVRHWFAGENLFVVYPNLNRRVDPGQPETALKHQLLNDKRFRQALSLAVDRQAIIDAEYNGQGVPAQVAPEPGTPQYHPELYSSYVQHDPEQARRLLDDIGLTQRDDEGYRTFADGSRMTFFLAYSTDDTGIGPAEFLVADWGAVGVRVLTRGESRTLFTSHRASYAHDIVCWSANGSFPMRFSEAYLPLRSSFYAPGFARWYDQGGMYGPIPETLSQVALEPPPDHPLRRAMELYDAFTATVDVSRQRELFTQILDIAAENVWSINIGSPFPTLLIVDDGFRNVPQRAAHTFIHVSPSNAGPETFYLDDPADSPGAVELMKQAITTPTLPPELADVRAQTASGGRLEWLLRAMVLAVGVLLIGLIAFRHPYVGRRLLIMVPTLGIISVVVFFLIQLPPGDYVSARILELEMEGDERALREIAELEELFSLNEPMVYRYAHWLGLVWFYTFDAQDVGLLQGHMGRSMENRRAVNDIVGDRILLTFLISLGTILFTWAVAIPIGIYSAVKQYSKGDYVLTFVGFIGMCVPDFLLALLLMFASSELLGIRITGLFSSQFGAQPEWTWGKVADLLQHIWVPIVVLGVRGTASMIRVMRANLLDELRKPYVITAQAKGVRPMKLLLKYPVRMALNPFISGIGVLFPELVSGGAIVGIIMSLPTVGPLMLSALMSEDMYLAGSMLMVLSLLGIMGTLVSDLLLLWLDPRIRFGGGSR